MKSSGCRIMAVMVAGLLLASGGARAGSLTPPGAPGPTMKTLEQVEPRIPISSAPFTISQSGSYYLTTNLISTGHGVVIAASDVTLDLMGFALTGDASAADYGIWVAGSTNNHIRNVVVHNGIVRNFGTGICAEYCQSSRFEHLLVASNLNYGVYLQGPYGQCIGNIISHCTVNHNNLYGIYLDGNNGQCDGNAIVNCMVNFNGWYGIYLNGSSGQCNGNTIANCWVITNGAYGIYFRGVAGQCNGNSVSGCAVIGNDSVGIYLYGYAGQCNDNSIVNCVVENNSNMGLYLYGSGANATPTPSPIVWSARTPSTVFT